MLTKTQKVLSYVFGILALIIGIVTAIPFRTLSSNCDILTAENIVKFVVFPIVILLLVTFPNVIKYKQLKEGVERSRTANILSFLPIVVYIVGALLLTVHTLTFKYYPMSDVAHGVLLAIAVVYLIVVICATPCLENIVMKLTKKGSLIVDSVLAVLLVIFAVIAFRVCSTYADAYAQADNGFMYTAKNTDPYLFALYIILFFVAVFFITRLFKFIKADETVVYAVKLTDEELDQLVLEEYDNAYNDILDDFEDYYDQSLEEEVSDELEGDEEAEEESAEEEAPAEEPVEEAPAEEPVEEEAPVVAAVQEPFEEETPVEEPAEEEAPAEEPVEEETPAEEPAEEEAPAEEPVEEETPAEEEAPAEEPVEEEAPTEEPVEEEAPAEEPKEEKTEEGGAE